MSLRINNDIIQSEAFLGEEINVEVALVDPTRESCPLVANVTMELAITAICEESGEELELEPFSSPPCISCGACQMRVSLREYSSLRNGRSLGKQIRIVASTLDGEMVEQSSPITVIRARLHLDNRSEIQPLFFKDAKLSTIPLVLSLRDRHNQYVDEFVELTLSPLYEDHASQSGVSPVPDQSILQIMGQARYLHSGQGRVDVRITEVSRDKKHKKEKGKSGIKRFVVKVEASKLQSGISGVLSDPIEVQAKYHAPKKSQAPKKEKGVAVKEEKCVLSERLAAAAHSAAIMAVGDHVVGRLRSLRWTKVEPSAVGSSSDSLYDMWYPNNEIDDLQAKLKSFLNGDVSAFAEPMSVGTLKQPPRDVLSSGILRDDSASSVNWVKEERIDSDVPSSPELHPYESPQNGLDQIAVMDPHFFDKVYAQFQSAQQPVIVKTENIKSEHVYEQQHSGDGGVETGMTVCSEEWDLLAQDNEDLFQEFGDIDIHQYYDESANDGVSSSRKRSLSSLGGVDDHHQAVKFGRV